MVRISARSATGAVAVGVAAGAIGLGFFPAAADQPLSTLVASPTSVSLDIAGPTTGGVDVGLDAGCLNAFGNKNGKGQTYGVLGVSDNTAVATVSQEVDNRHCAYPTLPAHFTVTTSAYPTDLNDPNYASKVAAACAAVGTATVTFTPVAAPPGLSGKLQGTTVGVTVTNSTGLDCSGGGTPPPPTGDHNPAAPAVANAYLNNNTDVVSACQKQFPGKAWRGNLISAIAHWMPTPESVKDDAALFPNNDWAVYVQSEVDTACKDGAVVSYLPPTGMPALTTLN